MATVSELVVLVTANTAGFQKGMASASKTTTGFSAVAKAGFAIAAVAAVKFVADSVEAYNDHQDALLRLQNTIDNSPALIGASTAAFEDQATALQNLTGFQDEEIIRADAVLGRFGLTADQLTQLNPLVLDYARATGTDATSSASLLGKALLGNARALKTVGINFVATGKTGQDFNKIQSLLESRVGGLAEAYGKTLPGQLEILAQRFDDVKETVGAAFIPILTKLLDIAKPLIAVLQLVADHLDIVLATLVGFAVVKYLPGLLLSIATGFEAIGAASIASGIAEAAGALGSAAPPAFAFAAAFAGLTAALAAWDPAGLVDDAEELHKSMEVNTKAFGQSHVMLGRVAVSSNLVGEEFADTTTHTETLAGEQANLAGEIQQVTADMKAQRLAAQQLAGGVLGLTATAIDLAEKQNRVNHMQEEGHDSGKKYRAAMLDLLNTQLQFKNDAADLVKKLKESGLSFDDAVDKVVNLGKHVGLTRKDVLDALGPLDQYRAKLDNIPGNVTTTIKANKKQAESTIVSLQDRLNTLTAHDYEIRIHAKEMPGSPIPSVLIQQLSKSLFRLTGTEWEINIHALADNSIKAVQRAIESTIAAIEKRIDSVSSALDKLKGKASAFAGTISGGIGGFGDLAGAFGSAEAGTSLSTVIADQVTQAKDLAFILKELKSRGAGKALLSQAAGDVGFGQALLAGGPTAVAEANKALNTIADLAKQTGKGLSEAFFGQKIDKIEHKLDILHGDLQDAKQAEKGITVIINADIVTDHDALVRKIEDALAARRRKTGDLAFQR